MASSLLGSSRPPYPRPLASLANLATMGSEEPKRIADYFVVVGLPKENPQVLDESALEDNFRATAHQDPITDVTVRQGFFFPVLVFFFFDFPPKSALLIEKLFSLCR